MEKKFLNEAKESLEKTKTALEEELKKFAEKDQGTPGDWDTKYPKFNGTGIEEAADEVEAFGNLLPVEHSLETRLKSIGEALEKIKKGKYGLCEKCAKEISEARLRVSPEAKLCQNCNP